MPRQFFVPIAILLLSLGQASAQNPEVQCRNIKDSTERLACFDKQSPTVSEGFIGDWQQIVSVSNLDKSKTIKIALLSKTSHISRYPDFKDFATFVIYCDEGKMNAYIEFKRTVGYTSNPISTQYRIGANTPVATSWSLSQDRGAYGPFAGSTTIPFLKKLVAADDFYVRGSDRLAGTSEALFDIKGIAEAIKPLRAACKW